MKMFEYFGRVSDYRPGIILDESAIDPGWWKQLGEAMKMPPKGWKLPLPQGDNLLGMEIEVEGMAPYYHVFDHMMNLGVWALHNDGSLRNGGIEMVSTRLRPVDLFRAVNWLYTQMKEDREAKKNCDFSWRTSIHIHCNINSLTHEEFLKFIMLYLMFERCLFRYCGTERRDSIFCVPLLECEEVMSLITTMWKRINGKKVAKLDFSEDFFRTWDKYGGLGVYRLAKYGTLEFRHMPGTDDTNKLFGWICLINRLWLASKEISSDELEKHIREINTLSHYGLFREVVFKEYAQLLSAPTLEEDIALGVMRIKEGLFFTPPANLFPKRGESDTGVSQLIKKSGDREERRTEKERVLLREDVLRRHGMGLSPKKKGAVKRVRKLGPDNERDYDPYDPVASFGLAALKPEPIQVDFESEADLPPPPRPGKVLRTKLGGTPLEKYRQIVALEQAKAAAQLNQKLYEAMPSLNDAAKIAMKQTQPTKVEYKTMNISWNETDSGSRTYWDKVDKQLEEEEQQQILDRFSKDSQL